MTTIEDANHQITMSPMLGLLKRKAKRLLNLDYAERERLPIKAFGELFPQYDRLPIKLGRYENHPTGIRMNELTYLCYLARSIPNAQIFEFGTSVGRTTLNLGLNVDDDGQVFSLDLPPNFRAGDEKLPYAAIQQGEVDLYPRGRYILEHRGALPVTLLTGNSMNFDFSPFYGRMDLVFIDGGHSLDVVANDSEQAFHMLKPERGIVAWHDYWSFNCPEVVRSVNVLADQHPISQLLGTRMAIFIKNGNHGSPSAQKSISACAV